MLLVDILIGCAFGVPKPLCLAVLLGFVVQTRGRILHVSHMPLFQQGCNLFLHVRMRSRLCRQHLLGLPSRGLSGSDWATSLQWLPPICVDPGTRLEHSVPGRALLRHWCGRPCLPTAS